MRFGRKTLLQVAALPYVVMGGEPRVLLVTSRRRRRWIIPKGWPEADVPLADTAAREALEEAGVIGAPGSTALGDYVYEKRMPEGYDVPCAVQVFPLLVEQHRLDWKERGQREIRWFALDAAAERVDDDGLARLLRAITDAPDRLPHP